MKRNIHREIRQYFAPDLLYNYFVTSSGRVFAIDENENLVSGVECSPNGNDAAFLIKPYGKSEIKYVADIMNEVGFTTNYSEQEIVKESSIAPGLYVTNFGNCFKYLPNGAKYFYKKTPSDNGYIVISYYGVKYRLHNLVAREFVPGYSAGLEVNHINRCRACNYYKNLEWVDHSANCTKAKREIYE